MAYLQQFLQPVFGVCLIFYLSQGEVFLHSSTTETVFRFVMLIKFWNKIFVNMSLAPCE